MITKIGKFFLSLDPAIEALILLMLTGLIIVSCIAIQKGILHIKVKGIVVGRPSLDNKPTQIENQEHVSRYALYGMVNFIEDFIESLPPRIIMIIKKQFRVEPDPAFITGICDKMHERMLTWIILNHIEETDEYISRKTGEAVKAVLAFAQATSPQLIYRDTFLSCVTEICTQLTREFVRQIVLFKKMTEDVTT